MGNNMGKKWKRAPQMNETEVKKKTASYNSKKKKRGGLLG